jgi:hypothetical protein
MGVVVRNGYPAPPAATGSRHPENESPQCPRMHEGIAEHGDKEMSATFLTGGPA